MFQVEINQTLNMKGLDSRQIIELSSLYHGSSSIWRNIFEVSSPFVLISNCYQNRLTANTAHTYQSIRLSVD